MSVERSRDAEVEADERIRSAAKLVGRDRAHVSYEKTNPWFYAEAAGHDYITPEGIGDAIAAGGTKLEVFQATLEAVEKGALEDASCCAFVALKGPEGVGWPK